MINCQGCGEPFKPAHGNIKYHSSDCQYEHKKEKQKENNAILKALKKGFLANYKLFTKLLPESGTINIALFKLLKTGFDQDAFYGTKLDNNENQWHEVNEYIFQVTKVNDQPTLQIYKP